MLTPPSNGNTGSTKDWGKISTYKDAGLLILSPNPKKKGKFICPNCDDDELSIDADGIKFDCYNCHDTKKILSLLEKEAWEKGIKPSAKTGKVKDNKDLNSNDNGKAKENSEKFASIGLKTLSHPTEVIQFIEEHYGSKLKYNIRTLKIELNDNDKPLEVETFRQQIAYQHNTAISKENLRGACIFLAEANTYDPVWDYLLECSQVKPVPINNLIENIFGIKHHNNLYEEYFKRWGIGCVERVFKPGCFNKSCLVLQGETHLGKSMFFKILGGDWFSDAVIGTLEKDDKMICLESWIIEIDEIGRITGKNADHLKQFISKQKEQFRPPYASNIQSFPRRFMLCGTVNEKDFLLDLTGNIRFWVIPVLLKLDKAKEKWLRANIKGIWATLYHLYKLGETSELPEEFLSQLSEENENFMRANIWEDLLEAFLIQEFSNKENPFTSRIECYKVLEDKLKETINKNNAGNQKQLTATLIKLGLKETQRTQPDSSRPKIWIPTDKWHSKYGKNFKIIEPDNSTYQWIKFTNQDIKIGDILDVAVHGIGKITKYYYQTETWEFKSETVDTVIEKNEILRIRIEFPQKY